MAALLKRISVDPNVCFGKPCIRGTRIWVSLTKNPLGLSPKGLCLGYRLL
ncbi:DUF433 domain-containing protein [Candidatus Poribacteria bacterium]|nr:DUF433 domain-containing protein [Candidatus Poribacteria bacterium]